MTENIIGGGHSPNPWPELPIEAWLDTCETLHLWTQIVGKIRLAQMQWVNHSWHVTLYVTARGLTTMPMPYGTRVFQIDFDFIDHRLNIMTSDGDIVDAVSRRLGMQVSLENDANAAGSPGFSSSHN